MNNTFLQKKFQTKRKQKTEIFDVFYNIFYNYEIFSTKVSI